MDLLMVDSTALRKVVPLEILKVVLKVEQRGVKRDYSMVLMLVELKDKMWAD